jgi:hypothetical protein
MRYVTIITKDRPGVLADISYILGKSSISLKGLNVNIVGENALISILVRDYGKTKDVLERNSYTTTESDVLVVRISNSLGGINKITDILSQARVTINGIKNLSAHGDDEVFSLSVDRPRKAARMLSQFMLPSY